MGRGVENYSLQDFAKEPAMYREEEQTAVSLFRAVNRGETELVLISEVRDGQQRAAQLLASVYDLPFASYDSSKGDILEQAKETLAFPSINYIAIDFDSFSKARRSLEGVKSKEAVVVWGVEGNQKDSGYIHFAEEDDWQDNISRIIEAAGVLEVKKEEEDNDFLYDYAAFSRLNLVEYSLQGNLDEETLRYAFKSAGHSQGEEENHLARNLSSPGVFLLYSNDKVERGVREVVAEYKHPDAVVAFLD